MSTQERFEEALRNYAHQVPQVLSVPRLADVRAGLKLEVLKDLSVRLGLQAGEVEAIFGLSVRTLQRRHKDQAPLTLHQSDRLWRVLHVYALAVRAFNGDEEAVRRWLTAPKALLGGETPLERLDTEPGFREVEDMLTVIDETAAA